MAKSEGIVMRVSKETKQRIESAAAKVGKSVTTFMLEAAEKEVRRVEAMKPTKGRHTGVPTYFRLLCREASAGGAYSYATAARELSRHLHGSEMPWDVDEDEWAGQVCELVGKIVDDDAEGVWDWFQEHYPKCMAIVPKRRWEQFVRGVYEAHEMGLIIY